MVDFDRELPAARRSNNKTKEYSVATRAQAVTLWSLGKSKIEVLEATGRNFGALCVARAQINTFEPNLRIYKLIRCLLINQANVRVLRWWNAGNASRGAADYGISSRSIE